MFTTFIVQPLFNLLTFIYAVLPGHNFGLAIILFTVVIRLLMWPLVKKQLRNARVMRKLQPELKRIKQETKGDRQRESMLVMELYKERGVNPFSSIGILIIQLPILIGLYMGLQKIIQDPNQIISFSYPFVQNLAGLKELAADISRLDMTLFGLVDLKRAALSAEGTYWPAMIIVIGSAVAQYYQSKQLMPDDKNARKLRHILREARSGEAADQAEINAAVGRSTKFLIPFFIFFVTVNLASALSLYWLTSGLVAMLQQAKVLKDDEEEIEAKLHPDDAKTNRSAGKAATANSGRKKVKARARVVSITTEGNSAKKPPKQKSPKKTKKRRR